MRRYLLVGVIGASVIVLGACGGGKGSTVDTFGWSESEIDEKITKTNTDDNSAELADAVLETPEEVIEYVIKAVDENNGLALFEKSSTYEEEIKELENMDLSEGEFEDLLALSVLPIVPIKGATLDDFEKLGTEFGKEDSASYQYENNEGYTLVISAENGGDAGWLIGTMNVSSSIEFGQDDFIESDEHTPIDTTIEDEANANAQEEGK